MISKAKEMIIDGNYSCIVVKDDRIIHSINGRGIKPLLSLYMNNKDDLKGCFLIDKVIGKAAAMLAIDAKVKYIYGYVMSKNAIIELKKNDIEFEYEILIDNIKLCPIEKIALKHSSTGEMVKEITDFLNNIL